MILVQPAPKPVKLVDPAPPAILVDPIFDEPPIMYMSPPQEEEKVYVATAVEAPPPMIIAYESPVMTQPAQNIPVAHGDNFGVNPPIASGDNFGVNRPAVQPDCPPCWEAGAGGKCVAKKGDDACFKLNCEYGNMNLDFSSDLFGVADIGSPYPFSQTNLGLSFSNGRWRSNCALGGCGMECSSRTINGEDYLIFGMQVSVDREQPITIGNLGVFIQNPIRASIYFECAYEQKVTIDTSDGTINEGGNGGRCDANNPCETGICTDGWCVTGPCDKDGKCEEGVCVAQPFFAPPGNCVDGGKPGEECVNGECESGVCQDGFCVDGGGPGEKCVDGKCAAGLVCNGDDYCVDPTDNGGKCDTTNDCDKGVCINGWCVTTPCDEDGECDDGVCVALPWFALPGMCVDGGEPGEKCVNGECQSGMCLNGYCVEDGGPGEECVNGQCAAGLTCNSDNRCVDGGGPGEKCVLGVCDPGLVCLDDYCVDPTDNGGKCNTNSDCDAGAICNNGWCITGPCGDDGECEEGVCVALPWFANPGMCVDGGDLGEKCVNGECAEGVCNDSGFCVDGGDDGEECVDGKCQAGLVCNDDGICEDPTGNGGKCNTNNDCDKGVCLNTWCVTEPCDDDGECDDGVCVALPWFALPGMCVDGGDNGKKCVNGMCKNGVCLNDICVEGGGPGEECVQGKCAAGLTCLDGVCVDPTDNGGKCNTNADCDKGVCQNGWCVTDPCDDDGECEEGVCVALPWFAPPGMCVDGGDLGEKCVNGKCAEGVCNDNGYCVDGGEPGDPCVDGKCHDACICLNDQCVVGPGPGEKCVEGKCAFGLACNTDGYCVDPTDNGGKCNTNNDCDAGAVCDNGWCVTGPCDDDGECEDGVCVAMPWFAEPGKCVDGGEPGEKCVNGECASGVCLNGYCVGGGGPGEECVGNPGQCADGLICNKKNKCVKEKGGWTVVRNPDYFGSSVVFGSMKPGFTMQVFIDAAMTIPVGMTNLFVGAPIYTQITWNVPVVTNVAGFFVNKAYVTLPNGQRITLVTDNCYSNTFGVVQLQANKLVTAASAFKFTSFVVGARQESMKFKLTVEIMLCSLSETKCQNMINNNDSQCPNTAGYNYRALTYGM